MAFCRDCGRQLGNSLLCNICGGKAHDSSIQNYDETQRHPCEMQQGNFETQDSYDSELADSRFTMMLIWSAVVNICCCNFLGLASLITLFYAMKNRELNPDSAKKKLNIAKWINIITMILWVLVMAGYFLLYGALFVSAIMGGIRAEK